MRPDIETEYSKNANIRRETGLHSSDAVPAEMIKRAQNHFHLKAPGRERHSGVPDLQQFHQNVIDQLEGLPVRTILDIGCGAGELLSMISSRKKEPALFGLDISDKTAALAGEKLGTRAEIRVGDVEDMPWENDRFDVVICSKSFHHYPRPQVALAEIRRVLTHCGRLILADFKLPCPIRNLTNVLLGSGRAGSVRIYSKNEILDLLDLTRFYFEKWTDIGSVGFAVSALVVKEAN